MSTSDAPLTCRIMGHRWHFSAERETMAWDCARCGAPGGRKVYGSPEAARRYAHAFEDGPRRGQRRFLLGAAPLWLYRRLRRG